MVIRLFGACFRDCIHMWKGETPYAAYRLQSTIFLSWFIVEHFQKFPTAIGAAAHHDGKALRHFLPQARQA
jgi:hypothetical protein